MSYLDRPSLTTIADEEGTDKGTLGPVDAWPGHNYTDVYEAYLEGARDRPITLLEIGLGVTGRRWRSAIAQGRNQGGGASMRMWYRYFDRARILGVDVNPAPHLDNDRIRTGMADQGRPGQLLAFLDDAGVELVDVIVDDGSHRPDHQQIALSTLFPRLAPGGLYFIEDLLDNGLGDGKRGRQASRKVLSTRRLLRTFARTGDFPEPHALRDPERLARAVGTVSFHCPEVIVEQIRQPRRLVRRSDPRPRFVAGKEQLCVVRKVGPSW